ncbi:MAG: sensor domain-containing diguanylate cyclase [Desulfobulbaceae bacterium]|nr:sensor domain-containing diguanylate cyclase [Desulfobulbaceae bacterium]
MVENRALAGAGVADRLKWIGLPIAVGGSAGVASGLFEHALYSLPALALGCLVFACAAWAMALHFSRKESLPAIWALSGPLLWTVAVWIITRVGLGYAPHIILLPLAFTAWLVVSYSLRLLVAPLAAIALMEGGLFSLGIQDLPVTLLNLICYGLAAMALSLFVNSKAYRRRVRKVLARAKREAASRECARDLGLFADVPAILNSVPEYDPLDDPEAGSQPAVEAITAAFDLQLELIRQALELTTIALLWPEPEGKELRMRGIATARADIDPGPYRVGAGITGALMGSQEMVAVAPVSSSGSGLPYYRKQEGVGSILALRIPDGGEEWVGFDGKKVAPILCVDRVSTEAWNEADRAVLRLAAARLAQDVRMGREFQGMAQERCAMQRVCIALRELNSVLGLEQVLTATIKAVRILMRVDFISISLVSNQGHQIALAEGDGADKLIGQRFAKDEGLVGQVIKINRSLPASGRCHGPTHVFGQAHSLTGYKSLLVLPLQTKEGESVGALTMAVKEANAFTRSRQEILALIAAQVAVKVDLGQAHEQINRMATTDGLTGLINHRTFQHGFDIMLSREQRRAKPLTFVLCDIDHFKKVNDTYGHPFGDEVLKAVAGVLLRAVRNIDLAARYGGEEFALIFEDANEKSGVKTAERIRQEIENLTFNHQGETVRVTISMGLAVYPRDGEDKATLISRADQALYRAKQQGRNRVLVWQA